MLERFKREPDPALQEQIDAVIEQMTQYGPDSPEYPKMMEFLERLEKLQADKMPKRIDRNQVLVTGGTLLLGIFMLTYEKSGVITSKVQALVVRPMKP